MKAIAVLCALCLGFSVQDLTLCDAIGRLKPTRKLEFRPEIKNGFITSEAIKITPKWNAELFPTSELNDGYIVSKFKISDKRTGIISQVETREGESNISSCYLHVVENCKTLRTFKIMTRDNDVIIYEIASEFDADFRNILIRTEHSSELQTDAKAIDTVFTEEVKIDLTSPKFDTISRKKSFYFLSDPPK